MPIAEVRFDGKKPSMRHLDHLLGEFAKDDFFVLGEQKSGDSATTISTYIYCRSGISAEIKKSIDLWIMSNFRLGTSEAPKPDVEILHVYDNELSKILAGVSGEVDSALESKLRGYESEVSRLNSDIQSGERKLADETKKSDWAMSEVERLGPASLKLQEYEEQIKAKAAQIEDLQKAKAAVDQNLEDNYKAISGMSKRYGEKAQQVKNLVKQLEERQAAVTPYNIRVAEVNQSAADLKLVELELQSNGFTNGILEELLSIPSSLASYVNQSIGTSFKDDKEVQEAIDVRYAALSDDDTQNYLNAKKSVKFYEAIKAAGLEVPIEMAPMISQLELTLENRKTAILEYDLQEKVREEALKQATKISDLLSNHRKSASAQKILAKLPKLEIYMCYNEDGSSETYVPLGIENGAAYKIFKNFLGDMPKVDAYGVATIVTPMSKDSEHENSLLDIKHDLQAYFKQVVIHKDSTL